MRVGDDCWRRLRDWQLAGVWDLIHFVALDWLARCHPSPESQAEANWHPAVNHSVTAMQGTSDASGTTVSVADPI